MKLPQNIKSIHRIGRTDLLSSSGVMPSWSPWGAIKKATCAAKCATAGGAVKIGKCLLQC